MNINATLLGQMITFSLFVAITMKWIWPLFKKILDERAEKIADGLAAAEKGQHKLEIAAHKAHEIVQNAKQQAAKVMQESTQLRHSIIEQAKEQARAEAERILANGRSEIVREMQIARETLRQDVAKLAILGAEKILQRQINLQDAEKLLADVASQL